MISKKKNSLRINCLVRKREADEFRLDGVMIINDELPLHISLCFMINLVESFYIFFSVRSLIMNIT